MAEKNAGLPQKAPYFARIEKFREEMGRLSKLIESEPPQEEIRRFLQKPDLDEDSSESSGEGIRQLLNSGSLHRDSHTLKRLSVQQLFLDSNTSLKPEWKHLPQEHVSGEAVFFEGNGNASSKNITAQEETATCVHKLESELSVGTGQQENFQQLLRPINNNCVSAASQVQQAEEAEKKQPTSKKTVNKKGSLAKTNIKQPLKQSSIPKSASNKDLKRSLAPDSFKFNSRFKPTFEAYNSVTSVAALDKGVNHQTSSALLNHPLSPKINARKIQVRRMDATIEESHDMQKKLQINLSQMKSSLQKLAEERHITRSYLLESRRYDGVVQSISLSELEKQLEIATVTTFPYRTETLRLLCEFASQFSRKVNHQLVDIAKGKGTYDQALFASLPILQTLTAKLCSNNVLSEEKYRRLASGSDALWASLKQTHSFDRIQLMRPFQLLQALKQYLQFLVNQQLIELTVKRNLYTKRKVCGYYSQRSHRQRHRNTQQKCLERSYKNERKLLHAVRSEKKLDRAEWNLQELRQQIQAKRNPTAKPMNQLSTRSKNHFSPVWPLSKALLCSTSPPPKTAAKKVGKHKNVPM